MSGRAELRSGPVVRGLDPAEEARRDAGDAYRAVIEPLEARLGVEAVDRVWAFPPRDVRGVPAALIVASSFAGGEGRRRLVTARLVVEPLPEGASRRRAPETRVEVESQGEVPVDRVPRLLDGVVRRLGADLTDQAPFAFEIGGDRGSWTEMRESLLAAPIEEVTPVQEAAPLQDTPPLQEAAP